jgi:hypothetical protein
MKIAVATPVYQTPRPWLEQCLASVRGQTIACTHFLVNDGDDSLKAADFPGVEFLPLPAPHADYGNEARAIASLSASGRGFDAIAYLDADNWFEADHLQQMTALHERTGAMVCTAARNIVDLEGCLLGRCPEVDGETFVDTSCLYFTRAAFGLIGVWQRMPRSLSAIGDRVMWRAVKDGNYSRAHRAAPTVNFRSNYRAHYMYFGKTPLAGAKHVHVEMSADGQFVSAKTVVDDGPPSASSRAGPSPSPPAPLPRVQGRGESELAKRHERVSLCMIVKDEEKNLAECLTPVTGLFDEVIVVDTGSSDRTKEVARRCGAKVYDFIWVDSFAAARNESLRHAGGAWIFWLDGDERLDEANLEKLRRLLGELRDENNAYMMCQRSAPDQLTGATLIVDQARLFRNLPAARWRSCHVIGVLARDRRQKGCISPPCVCVCVYVTVCNAPIGSKKSTNTFHGDAQILLFFLR